MNIENLRYSLEKFQHVVWRVYLALCSRIVDFRIFVCLFISIRRTDSFLCARFNGFVFFSFIVLYNSLSCLGGAVGALFVHLNSKLNEWRSGYFPKRPPVYRYIEVLNKAIA